MFIYSKLVIIWMYISKSFQEQQEKRTTQLIEDIENSEDNIRLTMDV